MSSRPFNARNTSGTCYFCARDDADDTRIKRGDRVLYLTARAVGDAPGRPLNTRELKIWRRLGRERKVARKARRPVPKGPEWLWDRMVHVTCATACSFPVPGGEASPINGTRWRGYADGAQTGGTAVAETPGQREARAEMELAAEAVREVRNAERVAAAERTRIRREATEARAREARAEAEAARQAERAEARRIFEIEREAARVEREARKAREAEDARIAAVAAEDAGVARFLRLNLEDDAPPVEADPDAYDASVERFKRLDLD